MKDLARQAAAAGQVVLWEEVARDGAQAKTLLTASLRVEVARASGGLFGEDGASRIIFAAGYPSICRQEFEIMRQLAAEVDNCSLASHGRATRADIDLGLAALEGALHPRVSFWIPISNKMAGVLALKTPQRAVRQGFDMLSYALDRAGGIPIDVALADASRADPGLVADVTMSLTAMGASIIKVCDSVGKLYPWECRHFYQQLFLHLSGDVVVGVHHHNDLGFALANNIEAVCLGARVLASSWLGLGERNGLAATEQMIFALSGRYEGPSYDGANPVPFWPSSPALDRLVPIAQRVSAITGIPRRITDPIVGSGVNTISTGTPFIHPAVFRPYDPELLGISTEVLLTHLANRRVITAVAAELDLMLTADQVGLAMEWVKGEAYRRGTAIISKPEFFAYLQSLVAAGELAG